jgi:arylsulfate sulfotransferase
MNSLIWPCLFGVLAMPAFAAVKIMSVTPSVPSPQVIGTAVTWTVTATDSNPGPLTFQFNLAAPGQPLSLVKDFNVGTLSGHTYTAQPFAWVPTGPEGTYNIQVVIKDFTSGQTASQTVSYSVTPLATGSSSVVAATANPLIALFSAPACPSGSNMRASFRQSTAGSTVTNTYWAACTGSTTMTFEIAGMYPTSTYLIHSETETGGKVTSGANVKFTTGALPTSIPFPTFQTLVPVGPQTDTAEPVLLWGLSELGKETDYRNVATDLTGRILWFENTPTSNPTQITRPVANGGLLTIGDAIAWNTYTQIGQVLRQVDLAGNIIKESNTGVIQQELLALGAADGGPCTAIAKPAPVGAACLDGFNHELTSLPNGYVAALASIEKIFPPGTQGDTSGLPVDIIGNMLLVMNANWQVVWYWDAFDYLDVSRAAILGETCGIGESGCPPVFLLGTGIAPLAPDWLHGNSIYYWPQSKDLIFSMKDQDWVVKIDYNNGAGTKDILWTMGVDGNFTFNNINDDPWPWFSHQHDVTVATNGAGPLILFDNGDTRISPPPLGLGNPGCEPNDCNSRGMSLTVDETTLTVTPVLSANLGVYSSADGAAELLADGNYFFHAALLVTTTNGVTSQAIELSGTTQVLNIQGPQAYRGWQMTSLYTTN